MGWYDAFSGNVARVNMNAATSDTGSAAQNFGDAFVDFGKSMREVETERSKDALTALQTSNEQNKLTEFTETSQQKKQDKEYLSKAYEAPTKDAFKEVASATTPDGKKAISATPETMAAADLHFQNKFNNEAVNLSINGQYGSFKEFSEANPVLVKEADGDTITKIDKYFSTKNTDLAALQAQEKATKHQRDLLKLQQKVDKNSGKGDEGAKFTELQSTIKTYMGVDGDFTNWNADNQKLYLEKFGIMRDIANRYNLPAEKVLEYAINSDKYDFSDPTKITVKPVAPVKSVSWKDYQK
ncbi:MAG: hypothetical protein IBX43_04925 [Campylobacterales bacterium]|nr:hypothetical protein [Campylobacterales bacterium]